MAAECLLAWLRACCQHWRPSFEAILGDPGAAAITSLDTPEVDPNRYLELRRIAIENLAGCP